MNANTQKDSATEAYYYIRNLHFIGNTITKEKIILREMTIRTGDSIRKLDMNQVLNQNKYRILNVQLFTAVEGEFVILAKDSVDITFTVHELFYYVPNPIFSLADRNFNVWYKEQKLRLNRTNIGSQLTRLNFRGRGERLGGTIQVGYSKYFDVFYKIPYVDKKLKRGAGISMTYTTGREINYRTNENKLDFYRNEQYPYKRFQTEFSYTSRPAYALIHEWNVSYNYYSISEELFQKNQNFLGGKKKVNYFELKYALRYNNTDIRIYPLNGFEIKLLAIKRGLGIDKDINQYIAKSEIAYYYKITERSSASFVFRGQFSLPVKQPYFLSQALGFKNEYARGYEYYVIDGSSFGLLRANLRYKIANTVLRPKGVKVFEYIPLGIYAKVYNDIAYAYSANPLNSKLNNQFINGFGMGIDLIISYYFKFRIEYSFNHLQQNGLFLHGNNE